MFGFYGNEHFGHTFQIGGRNVWHSLEVNVQPKVGMVPHIGVVGHIQW